MNYFVFVVCGDKEHVHTLNYSLKFIRHFSKHPALVVTDIKRNEIPVEHNQIINIDTPPEYNHHQASIYLKTGLHKFLDLGNNNLYCYLDSDVVAIDFEINSIFNCFTPPIIFAKDHCPFNEFSPHVIKCGCLDDVLRREKEYSKIDAFFKQKFFSQVRLFSEDRMKLDRQFADIKKKSFKGVVSAIKYLVKRYILPTKYFSFGNYYFNKKDHFWYNSSKEIIHINYKHFAKKLYLETGMKYNYKLNIWLNKSGEDITPKVAQCHHFQEYVQHKYEITIPYNWRHWNGGVFLFNAEAYEFMNYWHEITLKEFENPLLETRDQGTLAVSAWKFKIQDIKTLSVKYNFITEFNNSAINWAPNKGYTYNNFKSIFKPYMLHIYHHWGDTGWSIWQSVMELEKENKL